MDQNAELLKLGKAQSQPIIEQLTGYFIETNQRSVRPSLFKSPQRNLSYQQSGLPIVQRIFVLCF